MTLADIRRKEKAIAQEPASERAYAADSALLQPDCNKRGWGAARYGIARPKQSPGGRRGGRAGRQAAHSVLLTSGLPVLSCDKAELLVALDEDG